MLQLENLLLDKLLELQNNDGKPLDIKDDSVKDKVKNVINEYFSENDSYIYEEIKKLASKIQKAKEEVTDSVMPNSVDNATLELDSVLKSTENAANNIMDASEAIQNLVEKIENTELKNNINDEVIKIFEECNFQDLTGQRINKVVNVIKDLDASIKKLIGVLAGENVKIENKSDDDALMNGPQLEGQAPSQQDIDKLFNDN